MLILPNVTLVAVSSIDLDGTLFALSVSSSQIQFGVIKLLTSELIKPVNENIKVELIPKLDYLGYSKFMLEDLHSHIDTPHCLVIQADGFVLNPSKWQDKFLDYDYIGAPWPKRLVAGPDRVTIHMQKNRVGNGGFSLRSKKLLLETSKINFDSLNFLTMNEDMIIGHYMYEQMVAAGIRFPEPDFAAKFSVESPHAAYGQSPNTSFGFHGKRIRDQIFNSIAEG